MRGIRPSRPPSARRAHQVRPPPRPRRTLTVTPAISAIDTDIRLREIAARNRETGASACSEASILRAAWAVSLTACIATADMSRGPVTRWEAGRGPSAQWACPG